MININKDYTCQLKKYNNCYKHYKDARRQTFPFELERGRI